MPKQVRRRSSLRRSEMFIVFDSSKVALSVRSAMLVVDVPSLDLSRVGTGAASR